MCGSLRIDSWSHFLLSLLLLTANVVAPFRSSDLGRSVLHNLGQKAVSCSMIRVRAVSLNGASQGFRVVVGLAKGGPDRADHKVNAHPATAFLSSRTTHLSCRHDDRPVARPNPPLRC